MLLHYSHQVLKSFRLTSTNVDHVLVDNPEKNYGRVRSYFAVMQGRKRLKEKKITPDGQ